MAEMKSFVDRRYGNCFVFNWNGTRMIDRASKDHGFFVQMNVQRYYRGYFFLELSGDRGASGIEPRLLPSPIDEPKKHKQ